MATTATLARPQSSLRAGVFTVTMSNSYITGGEPVSFAGFKRPIAVVVTGCSSNGYSGRYNLATRTFQVFRVDAAHFAGAMVEMSNAAALTGTVFTVLVVGI